MESQFLTVITAMLDPYWRMGVAIELAGLFQYGIAHVNVSKTGFHTGLHSAANVLAHKWKMGNIQYEFSVGSALFLHILNESCTFPRGPRIRFLKRPRSIGSMDTVILYCAA